VTAYFDTSIVTKWYLPEPDSADALRVRARFAPPAVLTPLHRVELVTAWHLKVFRHEIAKGIVDQAWGHVSALVLEATAFVTHDDRQARLAKAAGLRVPTLRARATRR